ncbi:MAG: SCO6745 family protein [Acidimicrobiales bacterium]
MESGVDRHGDESPPSHPYQEDHHMQYDEAVEAFFIQTPEGTVPEPTRQASVARRLRDAIEPIAMHPVWSRHNNEAMAGLGLDFFSGYAWGRAAALGEPAPAVVVSSFAVFEPSLIAGVYEAGRAACGRDQVLSTRFEATTASLAGVLDGVDVSGAGARLRDAALGMDQSGRPLYAGLAEIPLSDDPVETLWRSAEMIREHRGDSHIAACVAEGLDPIAMSVLTELWVGFPLGEDSCTRGGAPEAIEACADRLRVAGLLNGDQLSASGQALRDRIEAATDRAQDQLVAGLGDDVDGLVADLASWSERCVAASAFPPNAYKRAAG